MIMSGKTSTRIDYNSTESISMVFWMLAREVLMLRGNLDQHDDDWTDVLVDLFYFKDLKDRRTQEELEAPAHDDEEQADDAADEEGQGENWNEANN